MLHSILVSMQGMLHASLALFALFISISILECKDKVGEIGKESSEIYKGSREEDRNFHGRITRISSM